MSALGKACSTALRMLVRAKANTSSDRDWLTPHRNVLGNRDRLNRLLMLMQIQLNDVADEARYAAHVRDWLDARDGRAAERRLLADPVGYPSLRA
jgi:hypothetical protein